MTNTSLYKRHLCPVLTINIGHMDKILHIHSITKDEFISIIKDVIDTKITEGQKADKPQFYSVKEAAKLLDVSEFTIYNYIKKGALLSKRIGRKYLIDRIYLEKQLQEAKSLKYRR